MAEILLSLTIIGVVAAITLPSLTGNINERTWNTQRKALYARISQAISLMPALNGFGTVKEESSSGAGDAVDTAAETFVTAGLAKVLKINNICDSEHLTDCGIVGSYTDTAGSMKSVPITLYTLNSWFSYVNSGVDFYSTVDTKVAAFETQNGEHLVLYYNPGCVTQYLSQERLNMYGEASGFPEATMCANFIYDLNGIKGPNTFGKDIGVITVFNATDSNVVAPLASSNTNANNNTTLSWALASAACSKQDPNSRIPNIDELSSMLINNAAYNLTGNYLWSSTVANSTMAWAVVVTGGQRRSIVKTHSNIHVRCVKR